MQVPEAGKVDDALVHARVVLHRARAKRVEARVDTEGSVREGSEVPDELWLGEALRAPQRPEARAVATRTRAGPGGTFRKRASRREHLEETVDLCGRPLLGHRDEQRVVQARVVTAERVAGMDARRARIADRVLPGSSDAYGKLLERCLFWKHELQTGVTQTFLRVAREREAGLPQLAQPVRS